MSKFIRDWDLSLAWLSFPGVPFDGIPPALHPAKNIFNIEFKEIDRENEKRLGKGGFGEVCSARYKGRDVAVKYLMKDSSDKCVHAELDFARYSPFEEKMWLL